MWDDDGTASELKDGFQCRTACADDGKQANGCVKQCPGVDRLWLHA
jgi:hypothetical protein